MNSQLFIAVLAIGCGLATGCNSQPLASTHPDRSITMETETQTTASQSNPLKVAIVVFEGVELLDFTGPGEVFAIAESGALFEPYLVSEDGQPITSLGFAQFTPQYSMANCPQPDILVIPGGDVTSLLKPSVYEWVRKTSAGADQVMSVCTGAFVLANIGALDGLSATTHASALDRLEELSDKIDVRRNTRWVDNGKVITTAGIAAGIDGALHLVSRLFGEETAVATANYMEVPWEPNQGYAQQ